MAVKRKVYVSTGAWPSTAPFSPYFCAQDMKYGGQCAYRPHGKNATPDAQGFVWCAIHSNDRRIQNARKKLVQAQNEINELLGAVTEGDDEVIRQQNVERNLMVNFGPKAEAMLRYTVMLFRARTAWSGDSREQWYTKLEAAITELINEELGFPRFAEGLPTRGLTATLEEEKLQNRGLLPPEAQQGFLEAVS